LAGGGAVSTSTTFAAGEDIGETVIEGTLDGIWGEELIGEGD
jgi:hypothetical protein